MSPRTSRASSIYGVHPSTEWAHNIIVRMKEKTGRSLDEWVALVDAQGPVGEAERTAWLKREHELGANYAAWIAARSFGKGLDDGDPDAYLRAAPVMVDTMYDGAKRALRPIHDALVALGRSLGDDVKVCPCATIVPLFRMHVFAQIKPSTRTRIDLGLALGDRAATGRLIDTGGRAKKDRITHRVAMATLANVDAEVEAWMRAAYERK
ncbi:MAG: DUF5655 domain-containing protein [Gemmatimonadaceae bacterium]